MALQLNPGAVDKEKQFKRGEIQGHWPFLKAASAWPWGSGQEEQFKGGVDKEPLASS